MKNNKPHHQALKQAEQARNHHDATLQFYRETLLNKLCLVGISGQGVDRTFVADIQGDFLGQIAIALSLDNTEEKRVYFDVTQLRFYKVFSPEETEKFLVDIKVTPAAPLKII